MSKSSASVDLKKKTRTEGKGVTKNQKILLSNDTIGKSATKAIFLLEVLQICFLNISELLFWQIQPICVCKCHWPTKTAITAETVRSVFI